MRVLSAKKLLYLAHQAKYPGFGEVCSFENPYFGPGITRVDHHVHDDEARNCLDVQTITHVGAQ
jgi:hypothetical protein